MLPDEIYHDLTLAFTRRKFAAGLLVAFIDFLTDLGVPGRGLRSFDDLVIAFPRQLKTGSGATANTLIVMKPDGKTLSLRPFYNRIESYYRSENKRFDYPSAAPHATQAWADYINWLDALVTYAPDEVQGLRSRVNEFVLDTLASQEFDPASITVDPPLFHLLLRGFDVTAKQGEPTGAAFQGIVFGFLRADNPHLQIEIDKVRTGSKRLQRIGDVDGWEGSRLAISAEVKQHLLRPSDVTGLEPFANATGRRGAIGIVAALGFDDGVRPAIHDSGLIPLDRSDMLTVVELWDPLKQRTAIASLLYYARHIEKNSALFRRLEEFLASSTTLPSTTRLSRSVR